MKRFSHLLFIFLIIACSKDEDSEEIILSSENKITSFQLMLNGVLENGDINDSDKSIIFNTAGANLNSLIPEVEFSKSATIKPDINSPQNFSNDISYTVYAENGETNIYRIIVNNRELSTENKILSFQLKLGEELTEGVIDESSKIISFNSGEYDISNISPEIEISERATISPNPGIEQNFNNIVDYQVTSESGVMSTYSVIANKPVIEDVQGLGGFSKFYVGATVYVYGKYINPEIEGSEIYLSDGVNTYPVEAKEIYSSFYENINYTSFNFQIPWNLPYNTNYQFIYKNDKGTFISESQLDIMMENAPKFTSSNQNQYSYLDVIEITGENLYPQIAIPSNGNIFLITEYYYDIRVNDEKTLLELTLDYYNLFPRYYGQGVQTKAITLFGPNSRVGESFELEFY
ncbi:DUF5018 domain-containing protein [Leeuwenhoekiella marinoflava]|uniref:DUF5018 domain-containing protein n=2 Tax=Leeuwenhoekiella marinoflava TaxID=988 RepID=A0A4Q0PK48_9FLAO|nr:DUF5018 domain-containing protein [Leeuwenhoekiella marinoflava]RXG28347.1 putative protein DUF5018 [Leeuwenhoekiella marinoflava]SHF55479.1 protein of unknown function [Leeuwenhoekiella marinoflava DSM 3653]